jgi:MORN repeat
MTWPDGSMYCGKQGPTPWWIKLRLCYLFPKLIVSVSLGSFKKGLRDGRGIQTNANGSMYHCGLWKKDKPCIKGEQESASNSIESDSLVSAISLSDSAKLRFQRGGQNTSEEDIVIMESQSVVAADESMNSRRSHCKAALAISKEPQDLPTHSNSLALSPEVRTIPATPSKMDEVSSFGSCDQDVTPNFLVNEMERISL